MFELVTPLEGLAPGRDEVSALRATLSPGFQGRSRWLYLGGVTFEWDARKAAANLRKHRFSFEDAVTVFLDPLAITFPDPITC
jgi:Ribonuclease toxin, BrnT, of type II toxin-antitoxin system